MHQSNTRMAALKSNLVPNRRKYSFRQFIVSFTNAEARESETERLQNYEGSGYHTWDVDPELLKRLDGIPPELKGRIWELALDEPGWTKRRFPWDQWEWDPTSYHQYPIGYVARDSNPGRIKLSGIPNALVDKENYECVEYLMLWKYRIDVISRDNLDLSHLSDVIMNIDDSKLSAIRSNRKHIHVYIDLSHLYLTSPEKIEQNLRSWLKTVGEKDIGYERVQYRTTFPREENDQVTWELLLKTQSAYNMITVVLTELYAKIAESWVSDLECVWHRETYFAGPGYSRKLREMEKIKTAVTGDAKNVNEEIIRFKAKVWQKMSDFSFCRQARERMKSDPTWIEDANFLGQIVCRRRGLMDTEVAGEFMWT